MSLPCITLQAAKLDAQEQQVVEFFHLPKDERDHIIMWARGFNLITLRRMKLGSRHHVNLGASHGWPKYFDLAHDLNRSTQIYELICRRYKEEMEACDGEFQRFRQCYLDVLDLPEGAEYYFDLTRRNYRRPPLVPLKAANYKLEHACPKCKMLFSNKNLKPFYKIAQCCDCVVDEVYEFQWEKWQLCPKKLLMPASN